MSIYGSTQFKGATGAKTPQFAAAEAAQHQLNQNEKARINSLRQSNMRGAKTIYNEVMGDETPIEDTLRGWFGGEEEVAVTEEAMASPETAEALRGYEDVDMFQTSDDIVAAQQNMEQMQYAQQLQDAANVKDAAEATAAGIDTASAVAAGADAASAGSAADAGGGMMSSISPWLWLARVIDANETAALDAGRRDPDEASYRTDLITGAVMEQDAAYAGNKMGGAGGELISTLGQTGNPEGNLTLLKDFGENITENPFDPLKMWG